jgi:multidrug resistance protein, MATE family
VTVARPPWWSEFGSVARLALPIVASLATGMAMALVDSAVVGPLGAVPLAVVSLTSSVWITFIAALYGYLTPVGVLAARAHGAGDAAGVASQRRAGSRLALAASSSGALLMCAGLPLLPWLGQPPEVLAQLKGYWLWLAASMLPASLMMIERQTLEAVDRPWHGVGLSAVSVLVNAALSWPLAWGLFGLPALGLVGAGIGTFGAYAAAALAGRMWIAHGPGLQGRIAPRSAQSPGGWRASARRQHHEGTPMGVQYLLEAGAAMVAGFVIGSFGAVALAANQVTLSVAMVLYMVPLGMAAAVGLRIAQALGGGQRAALRPIALAGIGLVTVWMAGISALLALAGPWLARLFTDEPAVIALSTTMFFVIALMQVADGLQSVSLGALRGMLDSRWPTRVSIGCYWLLAVPMGWVLAVPLGLGPAAMWGGFGIGVAVAALALGRRLWRLTAY